MKSYVVGGAVRDALLGLPVQDRDHVVVGATPEQMVAQGFRPVGKGVGDLAAARLYFAIDAELGVGDLERRIAAMPVRSRWTRMALAGLQDELSHVLRKLTTAATRAGIGAAPTIETRSVLTDWLNRRLHGLVRYRQLAEELSSTPDPDLAMLSVAVRALADLGRAI